MIYVYIFVHSAIQVTVKRQANVKRKHTEIWIATIRTRIAPIQVRIATIQIQSLIQFADVKKEF